MDESEKVWREEQAENGWTLPPPAPWPLRLPLIRNLRGAWHMWRAERQALGFATVGIGLGRMNQHDRWLIYAIYRGWW